MIEALIAFTLLANAERAIGYQFTPDAELSLRAQDRAEELCENRQWSHEGLDKYFDGFGGENLARGFDTIEDAHEALMNSPKHRANILHWYFTKMGVGEACGTYVIFYK